MCLLNHFRKPKITIILALGLLTFSCTRFELIEYRSFDYSAANFALENDISFNLRKYNFNESRTNTSEILNQILDDANRIYDTSIEIPESVLLLALDHSIQSKGLELGYLSNEDILISNSLETNFQNTDFRTSLTVFEHQVNNMNLSTEEFNVYNHLANMLQIANDNSDSILNTQIRNRDIFTCLLALVSLGIAYARLGMCSPGGGYSCLYATYYVVMAILAVSTNCDR